MVKSHSLSPIGLSLAVRYPTLILYEFLNWCDLRKVMTNLGSILKSRDITLPTKIRLVKAMVFPVVMYGCESWTVRKLSTEKLMILNHGVGKDS